MIVVFGTYNVLLPVNLVYRHYCITKNMEDQYSLSTDRLFTTYSAIIVMFVSRRVEPSLSCWICIGGSYWTRFWIICKLQFIQNTRKAITLWIADQIHPDKDQETCMTIIQLSKWDDCSFWNIYRLVTCELGLPPLLHNEEYARSIFTKYRTSFYHIIGNHRHVCIKTSRTLLVLLDLHRWIILI